MRPRHVYYAAFMIGSLWVIGIILAPFLKSAGLDLFSDGLYSAYSKVCHQRPERTISIFGEKMAVCTRCFGIYLGAYIGVILSYAFFVIKKVNPLGIKIVALSIVPLAIDGVTQLVGLRESTNLLRFITGGLFGIVFIVYFLPLIVARERRE